MDKYLIFRLENRVESVSRVKVDGTVEENTSVTFPCFDLVKEFEINAMAAVNKDYDRKASVEAQEWAIQYSLDNKVRTLVVKGSVFGD